MKEKNRDAQSYKSAAKLGFGLIPRLILGWIMCLIIFVSMTLLFQGIGGKKVGYTVRTINEDGTIGSVEAVYFDDEITSAPESDSTHRIDSITEMPTGVRITYNIVTQLFMILLITSMIYDKLWADGSRDQNLAAYGHITPDKLKGLKAGFFAAIPSLAFVVIPALSLSGAIPDTFVVVYKLLNIPFRPYLDLVMDGSLGWGVLPLILLIPGGYIIAVSAATYLAGYKQIVVVEKLLYKRRKG